MPFPGEGDFIQAGLMGLFLPRKKFPVWNRTGATVAPGELVQFDVFGADAATLDDQNEGDAGYPLSNVINPATSGIGGQNGAATPWGVPAIFGVVTGLLSDQGVDDKPIEIAIGGVLMAKLTNDAILKQSLLVPANGVRTLALAGDTAGRVVLGIALKANSSTAGTFRVLFNGFGWGVIGADS